jgi:hypothetical protein
MDDETYSSPHKVPRSIPSFMIETVDGQKSIIKASKSFSSPKQPATSFTSYNTATNQAETVHPSTGRIGGSGQWIACIRCLASYRLTWNGLRQSEIALDC